VTLGRELPRAHRGSSRPVAALRHGRLGIPTGSEKATRPSPQAGDRPAAPRAVSPRPMLTHAPGWPRLLLRRP
jgi:hypothetical protein